MYKRILVAIDGSADSLAGGAIALQLAKSLGSTVIATNVYDAQIHTRRFHEMESILPGQYREADSEDQLREVHNVWTNEGFLALSRKRLAPYLDMCKTAGVTPEQVSRQGRNYVELLRAADDTNADLIIIGTSGLGAVDGQWGSTAARVLRGSKTDVLLARSGAPEGDVVVGIDGSEDALRALERAQVWADAMSRKVILGAVYDPFFHTRVLESLEGASSAYEASYHSEIYKAVEEHGDEHTAQVAVKTKEHEGGGHDQMVDEGLAKLYESFLEKAVSSSGADLPTELIKGKPYQGIAGFAAKSDASTIVVGRNGLHQTELSTLGSNAEGIVRLSGTNVLVVK